MIRCEDLIKPIALSLPPDDETAPSQPARTTLEPGMLLQTPKGAYYLVLAVNRNRGNCYYATIDPSTGVIKGVGQIIAEYAARCWKVVARVTIDLSEVEWLV